MKQQYIKIFLIVLGFLCKTTMNMDTKLHEISNDRKLELETILHHHIVWKYDDLYNASLVNKTWYTLIRSKNVCASQRKEFLKQLIVKNFSPTKIDFDGFVFHPSGCIAGCLWRKMADEHVEMIIVSLSRFGCSYDNNGKIILLIKDNILPHYGQATNAKLIKGEWGALIKSYTCRKQRIMASKPFFINDVLKASIRRVDGQSRDQFILSL